jgi:hypothetical protein
MLAMELSSSNETVILSEAKDLCTPRDCIDPSRQKMPFRMTDEFVCCA